MRVVSTIAADIIQQIGQGQGANSAVFLAHYPHLNDNIVIKVIPKSGFRNPTEYFQEAQAVYRSRSPRVVPIMYASETPGEVWLAMPYYPNGSAVEAIRTGSLTTRQVVKWGQQFLSGLLHVHSTGFVHLDIKPNNLLINNDGSVLLADFGQTRMTNQFGVAPIPPLYDWHMPPEVFGGTGGLVKQSDIYQAGLTLYRFCNGEEFYQAQKPRLVSTSPLDKFLEIGQYVATGRFPDRQKFRPHVPDRLKRIIRKAMSVSITNRYKTVNELMNALGEVQHLLDWRYDGSNGQCRWIEDTHGRRREIEIVQQGSHWKVEGRTVRKADNHAQRKGNWCSGVLSTKRKAENFVSKLFRDMEEPT